MKLHYFPDTDTLSIELSSKPSADVREIADGVVVDFDTKGNVIAIDIDLASKKVDLRKLDLVELPVTAKRKERSHARNNAPVLASR